MLFIQGLNGDSVMSRQTQILGLERLDLVIVDIIEDDRDFRFRMIRDNLQFLEEQFARNH